MNRKVTGATYFVCSIFICCLNDLLAKKLSNDVTLYQITFFKSLFGLLFVCFYMGKKQVVFSLQRIDKYTLIRSLILVFANLFWYWGLKDSSLSQASLANYSIPFFILLFCVLKKYDLPPKIAILGTIINFIGVVIPLIHNFSLSFGYAVLFISAFFYAMSDILCKKATSKVSTNEILIQTSVGMTFFSLPFLALNWYDFDLGDLTILMVMGGLSVTILLMMVKSYQLCSVSELAPLHYFEIIIAVVLGLFFLNHVPSAEEIMSSMIVLFGVVISFYRFKKRE